MRLKKAIILGAVLGLASIPLIANADLTINNKTPNDSAVMINGVCSGVLGLDTPSGQSRSYNMGEIQGLCGRGFTSCVAGIYTTKYCTSGTQIGSATINNNLIVTSGSVSAPYSLTGVGSNNVTLGG